MKMLTVLEAERRGILLVVVVMLGVLTVMDPAVGAVGTESTTGVVACPKLCVSHHAVLYTKMDDLVDT